jgi:hypothetical protein
MLVVSGCVSGPVERYVHEPTARIPNHLWTKKRVLPEKLRPAEGEVLLVPDFAAFSVSYPGGQDSFLHVFTRGNRSVVIIGADLEVSGSGVKQSIEVNISTTPMQLPHDDGYCGARLRLFSDARYGIKNVDFTMISGADNLVLTVRWRDGDRVVEQRFILRRVVRNEVAFIT